MTDLGDLAILVQELPAAIPALNRVVQGLLIHSGWIDHYGDARIPALVSRTTLPARDRLAALVERDGPHLGNRTPERREIGTCRDFALLMCAFLRAKGSAARVRCGFASYFGDGWEDHWVCEYWNSQQVRWCLTDAQLDDAIRTACAVTFDTSDVPRDRFVMAGEAWLRCRAGNDDPNRYGQGSVRGAWFMGVNVIRDAFAVNGQETSAWDKWREATPEARTVSHRQLAALDALARNPHEPLGALLPPW